jgi:hypothetical protein
MPEDVLEMLTQFATGAWGYSADRAEMAARIIWQCRGAALAGGIAGGYGGAVAGMGIASIPGWAVGAFGGILAGTLACSAIKGIPAIGFSQIQQASNETPPSPQNVTLLVASYRGDAALKQEMERLLRIAVINT